MIRKEKMAERTGLEPATPGVTGRYSNQLNYRSALGCHPLTCLFRYVGKFRAPARQFLCDNEGALYRAPPVCQRYY